MSLASEKLNRTDIPWLFEKSIDGIFGQFRREVQKILEKSEDEARIDSVIENVKEMTLAVLLVLSDDKAQENDLEMEGQSFEIVDRILEVRKNYLRTYIKRREICKKEDELEDMLRLLDKGFKRVLEKLQNIFSEEEV